VKKNKKTKKFKKNGYCIRKGGAWSCLDTYYLRAHFCYRNLPDIKYDDLGFRCVFPLTRGKELIRIQ